MFEEAFDESEILKGSQRGVLYMNILIPNENMPNTYLMEEFTSDDSPTPYILDELLDDLTSPCVFIFELKDQVFGAYADSLWDSDDKDMKFSTKNFLF